MYGQAITDEDLAAYYGWNIPTASDVIQAQANELNELWVAIHALSEAVCLPVAE